MKKIMGITIVLLLSLAFSAFAGSEPEADGPIELSMMDIWVESEDHHEAITAAVASFEAANPGVTIAREMVPSQAFLVQAAALGAANELPDIIPGVGSMTRQWAATGSSVSFEPWLEADPEWEDRVYDSGWLEHTYNGERYAQPIAEGNYGYIVYNTAILEEAGVDGFPANMDEFHEACDLIMAAGYIPIALGDADLWPADSINFSSFVNNYVGNDWTNEIFFKTGESAFTDQPFIDALAAFQELALKGYFNDNFISISHADSLALYLNGRVAFRGWGDWEEDALAQTPEVHAVSKVAAWPGPAVGAMASNSFESSSAWAWAVGSNATEAELPHAFDFISHYLTSDTYARTLIETRGQLSAWNMPDFDESLLPQITLDRIAFKESADSTPCFNWDSILDASVKDIYQRGLQSLLIGEITPEELARDMQDEFEMDM